MSQHPDLTIRRATPDDAHSLATLGARTFSETFAADNTPENLAAYLAASFNPTTQAAELGDPASSFSSLKLVGARRVTPGYTQASRARVSKALSRLNWGRLYVSREWLGHGVGEALMRACVEEARRAGHETIWLGVWERNGRALAFYRKWHFHTVGEHVFLLGSDPQRDIVMERAVVLSSLIPPRSSEDPDVR